MLNLKSTFALTLMIAASTIGIVNRTLASEPSFRIQCGVTTPSGSSVVTLNGYADSAGEIRATYAHVSQKTILDDRTQIPESELAQFQVRTSGSLHCSSNGGFLDCRPVGQARVNGLPLPENTGFGWEVYVSDETDTLLQGPEFVFLMDANGLNHYRVQAAARGMLLYARSGLTPEYSRPPSETFSMDADNCVMSGSLRAVREQALLRAEAHAF